MPEIIKGGVDILPAVILAGGRGTRMHQLSEGSQKCMLEVDGAPILEHIINGLRQTFGGNVEVVLATGYKGNQIRNYFWGIITKE